MKILHVVQNYYPSMGGTQTLFKEVSERLVKNYGDEVIVYTSNSYYGPEKKIFKKIATEEEVINGVKVKRFEFFRFHHQPIRTYSKVMAKLGLKTSDRFTRYLHGPWSPSMKHSMINTDADVICASSCHHLFMNYPLMKKANKPFIYMGALHFTEDESFLPIYPKGLAAMKKSTFIIANTEFEKQRLIKFGVKPGMVKAVGCGVDIDKFDCNITRESFIEKYSLKNDAPIVAFVGRHEPTKGIDVLIDAMEVLWKAGKNYNLLIAGSETQFTNELKKKIGAINPAHSSNITFISDFSNQDKIEIFNCLDVFVSVSTAESFGIVYLEAWACKKPVIGANIGAVRNVVSDNVDGYLISPKAFEDLAKKIDDLCMHPDKRKVFGNNGYTKTATNYTWDIIASKYRDVYLQAVAGKGPIIN